MFVEIILVWWSFCFFIANILITFGSLLVIEHIFKPILVYLPRLFLPMVFSEIRTILYVDGRTDLLDIKLCAGVSVGKSVHVVGHDVGYEAWRLGRGSM